MNFISFIKINIKAVRNIAEVLEKLEISQGYDKYSLESAKRKASSLRNELDGNKPILVIVGSYRTVSPSNVLSKPYILKTDLPIEVRYEEEYLGLDTACQLDYKSNEVSIYPNNPDEFLKPLDIVKVKNKKGTTYFHFAIYLGKNKICHITSDNQGVKIENWSDFLDGAVGELVHYHPVIPLSKVTIL